MRGPENACASCGGTNTRPAVESSDHPGVIVCEDCGETTYGGGKATRELPAVLDPNAGRDARLGALEPPGSYGLCWRDLPGDRKDRKCEREPHAGPCLRFELRSVEPVGTRETEAFVSRREHDGEGSCGLETLTLSVYPPEPRGARLREARTGVPKDALRRSLSFDFESGKLVVEGEEPEDRSAPYLSLREAADLTGLSVVELSGLETGRFALDDEGWERLVALVDEARRLKGDSP